MVTADWTFPYHHLAPREIPANLRWRRTLNNLGHQSETWARTLWTLCARDPIFWLNSFAWIFDPRTPAHRPFVTYPFQDRDLRKIFPAIGRTDIGVEKSREMGASWGPGVAVFAWFFLFRDDHAFLMSSYKQDLVDKAENPDALFWKFDYLIDRLPTWMKPRINAVLLHRKNMDNGSVVDGTSTTGDIGRAGRRMAILIDEHGSFGADEGEAVFHATQAVTSTRMFVSTPRGAAGAFYKVMHDLYGHATDMLRIRWHWREHPIKSRGLYTSADGQLRILDRDYPFGPDYDFVLDGKLRSPWYDRECRRPGSTPRLMAQEHDIEYLGSGNPFFDPQMLDMVEDRDGREPILVGDLLYVDDAGQPIRFREHPAGNLRLWTPLEASGRPPRNTYYGAGADISSGTGASNSCCTVIDLVTGQKVAEFVTGHVPPEEYARACAALCQWFIGLQPEEDGGCRLVWESNGPGRAFEKSLQRIGYWNIYFRETSIAGDRISHRKSDIPGWSSTQAGKKAMLGDYADALRSGKYVNPSRLAIGEARHFVHTKNGGVAHIAAEAEADPSGARSNHGDRCMADGLSCILLMEQAGLGADPVFQPEPPAGSVADYRRRRRNKQWNNYWGLDNDDRVTSDRGLEGTPTSPSDSAW